MDPPERLPIDIKYFMTNNEKLPEAILEDLQRGLAKSRREMANLEAEIQELMDRITQLEVQREKVENYIAQFDCVLSPMRRVPADILHHIFYHCLPTQRNPVMSIKEAPLLLTRVCRTWRQTAHGSPALWARLYITFSDEDMIFDSDIASGFTKRGISDILRLRCSAIEEWFSRSGACPLSISLCYTSRAWASNAIGTQPPGQSDNTLSLFRILSRLSTRWQKLELRMPIEVYRLLEETTPLSQLQMLDSVRTSFYRQIDTETQASDGEPAITLLQAPSLKRISLPFYPAAVNTIFSNPNLSKLTNLSLNWMLHVSDVISFLQDCPNLEYATLTLSSEVAEVRHATSAHSTHGIISLPRLRALSIIDVLYRGSGGGIYERLEAPALEWIDYTKQVGYNDHNEPHPDQTAVSALLRSSTNLKKLTIEGNDFSTSELRTILKSAQSISHLIFGPDWKVYGDFLAPMPINMSITPTWNIGEVFLQDDEGDSSDLTLLPHLEILEISQGPSMLLTDDVLQKIIIRRLDLIPCKNVAPLRKVAVLFGRSREIDISKELPVAYSENIELRLEYHNRSEFQSSWHSISSRYGMDQYGRSWQYRDIEEEVRTSIDPRSLIY